MIQLLSITVGLYLYAFFGVLTLRILHRKKVAHPNDRVDMAILWPATLVVWTIIKATEALLWAAELPFKLYSKITRKK